jgi:hypothetical protein
MLTADAGAGDVARHLGFFKIIVYFWPGTRLNARG